jgi:molecular chaperone HtpG
MSTQLEQHEFQSEAKQVLDLMINSVYSNPDIFMRELISNASDAIDKLRIEGLSNPELFDLAKNGRIDITVDRKANTLSISDNGLGMDKGELISYLGTIARSGTKEFIRTIRETKSAVNSDLIGQFGVGFYSSFIAADKVTVETKKAGADESWIWESKGDGTFTISPGAKETNGTKITLHIKKRSDEEDSVTKDYLSIWTLREIIKKYSDFVTYPIFLKEEGEEGKEEPVNSMKAIWTRPENEVSEEEYKEFYHHITHDWEAPLERISYRAEGACEFRALLYIPSRPPMDIFFQDGKHGIQLYIRRVFIMNDCRDLIPEYLRFIKGVVDSEDLSLNVSREILQQDRQASIIKNSITRKILDSLKKMKQEKPGEYEKFWQMFGVVLKEGIISDIKNRDQIMRLSIFDSTKGEKTTLEEYAANMPEYQKHIYYLSGAPVSALASSPKLEAFRAKNIEVLLLGDAVDEIWVNNVRQFEGHEFKSAAAEEIDLPGKEGQTDEDTEKDIKKTDLVTRLKKSLADVVEDVKISSRLVDSPVCFVQKGEPISLQMRNFLRSVGQELPEEKRVMEINISHPLIKKIASESEKEEDISEWANLLVGLASISEGEPVPDGQRFTKTLSKILDKKL